MKSSLDFTLERIKGTLQPRLLMSGPLSSE
jgi:hypothetical protein